VLAAVRALNRLQCVGETLRHALNSLAVAAPDWLRPQIRPEWIERYDHRVDEFRLPNTKAARQALAEVIGADGFDVLEAVYAGTAPPWLREVPAVETLRQVWVQQYHAPDGSDAAAGGGAVRWRLAGDTPPAARLINSPYDPDARCSTKRQTTWVGYKVHLTETCDPGAPHLVTHVETTPATTHDSKVVEALHTDLAAADLLPRLHIVDTGYVTSDLLVTSQHEYAVDLLGPAPTDHSWQARTGQGFDLAAFTVDWDARRVTCPQGRTSKKWCPTYDQRGNALIHVEFGRSDCLACPSRRQCTRTATEPRELGLRPRTQHLALYAARRRQETATYKEEYARRAGVEGTLSEGVRVCALRRARYVGLAKTSPTQYPG